MGKIKYLLKNMALFSISNFVTKILVFLLVPLYTGVLTPYEYGIVDIMQVTMLLLVPALTMNIGEAALRFGIEYSDRRGEIFKIGNKYAIKSILYVIAACLVASFFANNEIRIYLLFFVLVYSANCFYEFYVLFFQGMEKVESVVIGSITCTLITVGLNIYFLLVLRTGLYGYLYSQIAAFSVAAAVMYIVSKKNFGKGTEDKEAYKQLEKEMTTYSVPLIAYSTASWVNNASDRYLVLLMCGAGVNGIYGVAYKIPAILMVFQRIFAQSWQISATKTHSEKDSEQFFTGMYKIYNMFMVLGCGVLIMIVRILAFLMFKKEFFEAYRLVPPLLISVIFGALTGFLGSICLAYKDSKSMGIATGIGAVINVLLNIILIPHFAAMGASIATGISYFTMCMMALIFVKRHVTLKINIIRDIAAYILLIVESIFVIMQLKLNIAISLSIVFALCIIYFKELKEMVMTMISIIKRKQGI